MTDLSEFLRLITASELVGEGDVVGFSQEFKGKSAAECVDGLVARNVLTRWQSDSLLAGRYKGFFIDDYKLLEFLPDAKDCIRARAENLRTGKQVILAISPKRDSSPYRYKVENIAH